MDKLISVTAEKNHKTKHIGMYSDRLAAKRVANFIEEFAGENWVLKDVVEVKQKGVYNARPQSKPRSKKQTKCEKSMQSTKGDNLQLSLL